MDQSNNTDGFNNENGQRPTNHKAGTLASAFDDLPGPQLYDPSWYNNKLRGEFGRLGSRQMSGPVLPKSYHLTSEDLDNLSSEEEDEEEEEDDDDDDIDDASLNHPHVQQQQRHVPEQLNIHDTKYDINSPLTKQNAPNSALVSSPVTNEFDHSSTSTSTSAGRSGRDAQQTLIDKHFHHEQEQEQQKKSTTFDKKIAFDARANGASTANNNNSGHRKIRFSRKSILRGAKNNNNINNNNNTNDHRDDQQPPANASNDINRRQSRIFRASRLFTNGANNAAHNDKGDNDGAHDNGVSSGRKSTSLLRKSKLLTSGHNNAGGKSNGINRKSVIFEWPCTVHDSLTNIRNVIEDQYLGMVTLQKTNELRMQIPYCNDTKTIMYTLVVSVEDLKNNRGSKVVFRRSFGDSLRGNNDEFDFLCAQIHDQLNLLYPTSNTIYH